MNRFKKAFSVLLVASILMLGTGCNFQIGRSKLAQDTIRSLYDDEGYEEVDFDEIVEATDNLMWHMSDYDDELESGLYATTDAKKDLKDMFSSESLTTTGLFYTVNLGYDSSMDSATYFSQVSCYDDGAVSLVAISIDFSSSDAADEYYEDLVEYLEEYCELEGEMEEANPARYRYVTLNVEGDGMDGTVAMYASRGNVLIVCGIGSSELSRKIDKAIDEYCDLLDIESPTD